MHLTATSSIAFFMFAVPAAASPVVARQDVLQDWQVSSVSVFTPSGRPGSYPWARIQANVTDPNEINLGTAPDDGHQVIIPGGSQGLVCFLISSLSGQSHVNAIRIARPNGSQRANRRSTVHGLATRLEMATGL